MNITKVLTIGLVLSAQVAMASEYSEAMRILSEMKKVNFSSGAQRGKISKAVGLLEKSCTKGNGKACKELNAVSVIYLGVMPKVSEKMLQISCKQNNAEGCSILADIYFQGNGKSIKRSPKEGLKYLTKSCKLGNNEACFKLGNRYLKGSQIPKNVHKGVSLQEKLCAHGYSQSCVVLGYVYNAGKSGIKHDEKKSVRYFSKACSAGNPQGCYGLGLLYAKGKKDLNKAQKLFQKACNMKMKQACEAAKVIKSNLK